MKHRLTKTFVENASFVEKQGRDPSHEHIGVVNAFPAAEIEGERDGVGEVFGVGGG
jgi:hypothetical protein